MTTDPFTEAARAEAERSALSDGRTAFTDPSVIEDLLVHMAEWARTRLAAQETADGGYGTRTTEAVRVWTGAWPAAQQPTDYQIDVAMDAYAEASGQSVSRPWMEAAIDAYESAARRDEKGTP